MNGRQRVSMRSRLWQGVVAACGVLSVAGSALGHGIVDVDAMNPPSDVEVASQGGFNGPCPTCDAYQRFVPSLPILTGIDFYANASAGFSILTVNIYPWTDDSPPLGPALASAQVGVVEIGGASGSRYHVDFPETVLIPGESFWIEWDKEGGSTSLVENYAYPVDSGRYTDGVNWWHNDQNWAFRTYGLPIPEPGTAALLGAGLLVLGVRARSRRALAVQ